MGTELATAKADAGFALFFAQELHLFFQHLHHAAETFNITKELPQSIFKGVHARSRPGPTPRKCQGVLSNITLPCLAQPEMGRTPAMMERRRGAERRIRTGPGGNPRVRVGRRKGVSLPFPEC